MGVDICFLIFHGFSARMVLQSEVIPSLKREGLSVAVIAPNADEDGMKETAESLGITANVAAIFKDASVGEFSGYEYYFT